MTNYKNKKKVSIKLEEYVIAQTQLSRRRYFEYLKNGLISVNGTTVNDIKFLLKDTSSKIVVNGQIVKSTLKYEYYLFNKPKGMLSTMSDTNERKCIGDVIRENKLTVSPVGRLDRHTTGLMLLTNDGELSHFLMHPKHSIKKIYRVTLDKEINKSDFSRLIKGVILDDGPLQCYGAELLESNQLEVVITEGRNRIVRRLFEHLGYSVISLKRLSIGPFNLANLKVGELKKISKNQIPKDFIK